MAHLFEKKVQFLGSWDRHDSGDNVFLSLLGQLSSKKPFKAMLQLNKDGVRVVKINVLQGNVLHQSVKLQDILNFNIAPRNPNVLFVVTKGDITPYKIIAVKCSSSEDAGMFIRFYMSLSKSMGQDYRNNFSFKTPGGNPVNGTINSEVYNINYPPSEMHQWTSNASVEMRKKTRSKGQRQSGGVTSDQMSDESEDEIREELENLTRNINDTKLDIGDEYKFNNIHVDSVPGSVRISVPDYRSDWNKRVVYDRPDVRSYGTIQYVNQPRTVQMAPVAQTVVMSRPVQKSRLVQRPVQVVKPQPVKVIKQIAPQPVKVIRKEVKVVPKPVKVVQKQVKVVQRPVQVVQKVVQPPPPPPVRIVQQRQVVVQPPPPQQEVIVQENPVYVRAKTPSPLPPKRIIKEKRILVTPSPPLQEEIIEEKIIYERKKTPPPPPPKITIKEKRILVTPSPPPQEEIFEEKAVYIRGPTPPAPPPKITIREKRIVVTPSPPPQEEIFETKEIRIRGPTPPAPPPKITIREKRIVVTPSPPPQEEIIEEKINYVRGVTPPPPSPKIIVKERQVVVTPPPPPQEEIIEEKVVKVVPQPVRYVQRVVQQAEPVRMVQRPVSMNIQAPVPVRMVEAREAQSIRYVQNPVQTRVVETAQPVAAYGGASFLRTSTVNPIQTTQVIGTQGSLIGGATQVVGTQGSFIGGATQVIGRQEAVEGGLTYGTTIRSPGSAVGGATFSTNGWTTDRSVKVGGDVAL